MKQGTLVTRIVMVVLFLAVAAYFLGSAGGALDRGMSRGPPYSIRVNEYVEPPGLLVRREQVLTAETGGAIVDVLPAQGEKVGTGQAVAYLYQDATALERREQIQALRQSLQEALEGMDRQAQQLQQQAQALEEESPEEDLQLFA